MLLGLWKYLNGYVLISVSGFSRERFINLLAANNIFAWEIISRRNTMTLMLSVKGLKRIKPILRKTNCRFRIISKHGLPFILHRYRRRVVFMSGFAAFFVLIFFMSQFIWLIEIDGNTDISDAEILRFCESKGVYTGVYKHKIDIAALKDDLRAKYPQIAWISLTQNGTRLLIDISEKVKNTEILDYSVPCDIISNRDCIVTDIIVQKGTPHVKAGDAVKKGDVLIASAFDIIDENGQPYPAEPVHSTGKVRGKWHFETDIVIPYKHTEKVYTDKKETLYGFRFFNKNFNTNFIKSGTKFKKYDKINKNMQVGFSPDYPLPLVISRTVFYEYTEHEAVYTPKQAEKLAEIAAVRRILNDFGQSIAVLDKQLEFRHEKTQLTARLKLELEDDIGEEMQR